MYCTAPNVVRSGGLIPAAPNDLPVCRPGDRHLIPLGTVRTLAGDKLVGVRLDDTFFTFSVGRSRWGKTEAALARFLAICLGGGGGLYVDPHADAIERMRPYLVGEADRVVEINLARGFDGPQAGWNLFSMEGLGPQDIEARVSAVVDSFASTLGWGEINNRALTITTMAAQSLCELALVLPPELAPTIFQITSLLSDDDWRNAVELARPPRPPGRYPDPGGTPNLSTWSRGDCLGQSCST